MEDILINVANNTSFIITGFMMDKESRRRLNNMGIYRNDRFKRTAGNGSSPVIIKNLSSNSSPIAIGKQLAEGILVYLT